MSTAGPTWNGAESASFAKYLDQRVHGPPLQVTGSIDPVSLAALEALPIPAALLDPSGEVLGANQELLDILGSKNDSTRPTMRLPLPDGPTVGGHLRGVQAGRVWLARRDGMMDLLVVAVGLGADGCILYMVTDVSSRIAEAAVRMDLASRVASLTSRETQVLRLLIAAGTNKAVAQELGISPRTVEVYRGRVLRKLKAKSLSQAIAVVIAAGREVEPAAGAVNGCGRTAADAWRQQTGRAVAYNLQFR